MSPVVYAVEPAFRNDMLALARQHVDAARIARHYLHLGERQRRTYFGDGKDIQLKKLFYALRPAAALRWLRLYPSEAIPPMHFPSQMLKYDPPSDVRELTAELIDRKAVTRELGNAPLPGPIEAFIDLEFTQAHEALRQRSPLVPDEAKTAAETLFRFWVRRLSSPQA